MGLQVKMRTKAVVDRRENKEELLLESEMFKSRRSNICPLIWGMTSSKNHNRMDWHLPYPKNSHIVSGLAVTGAYRKTPKPTKPLPNTLVNKTGPS